MVSATKFLIKRHRPPTAPQTSYCYAYHAISRVARLGVECVTGVANFTVSLIAVSGSSSRKHAEEAVYAEVRSATCGSTNGGRNVI